MITTNDGEEIIRKNSKVLTLDESPYNIIQKKSSVLIICGEDVKNSLNQGILEMIHMILVSAYDPGSSIGVISNWFKLFILFKIIHHTLTICSL